MENYQNQNQLLHRQVRRWLGTRFSPSCAVFSSGTVKDILKKQSSITPAELFRPFAEVGNLGNISLQTCEKNQPFKLKNFKIDFIDSYKIEGNNQHDQSILIDFIIQNSSPSKFDESSQNINTIQTLLNGVKDQEQARRMLIGLQDLDRDELLTPWFSKWKRQFLHTTKYSDHELIAQPISFIYFVSATEHDPLGTIDIMKRAENMPSLYREGIYDDSNQNVQQFIFILNPTDNPKIYQDCYETVKQKFPPSFIYEIPMTRGDSNNAGIEDIWSKFVELDEQSILQELHLEQQCRGRSFSVDDRQKIKATVRRIIEKQILPFIERKIRNLEVNIANTRKGIKNSLKMLWKKPERGENDGLKESFKMNKEELELCNLVDLSFVTQDYETASVNAKIPYNDFKKCKAFRHSASCQEVQAFSTIAHDPNYAGQSYFKEVDQMIDNAYQLYHKSNKSQFLIRYALLVAELYDSLERYQESANYLLRISNEIKDQSVIIPLFQEQAAYKYLYMKQYRKFALHMILAGKSYEKLNLQNYSFNCFTIVHQFYQRHKGWNGIRFQLYSSLGRNSQNMGDINLAVKFFRNLLQLCCEFDHQQEQKNCLNEFLIAVQNWSSQKSINLIGVDAAAGDVQVEQKAHIGQLNLPVILEDSIEVFISSEKLHSNKADSLINNCYVSYPNSSTNIMDDNQEYVIQQKAELNSANCPWKFLGKHIFEFMNEEKRKSPEFEIKNDACQFNDEEINEFAIYDCSSRARKRDLTIKKIRRSYVGESIILKLLIKNPLMADIFINNIRLVCRYEHQENSMPDDFEQLERNIVLRSLETKEIILEIFPKKAGRFKIERIEWILFDVVSCAYQLIPPIDKDKKLLTSEELVVPKKLLERESNFIYDILPQSGEIQAKIQIGESKDQNNFIFTEFQQGTLEVQNFSPLPLRNGYIVCSHPLIFGFQKLRLFGLVEPNAKFELPLFVRASLMQSNEIKFLIRYEVQIKEEQIDENLASQDKMSRFRFTRVIFNIDSLYAFAPKRHVHLSTKKANEHIFNIQIVDNVVPGSFYQTPQIQAIEIINRKQLWTLKKKDNKGQFFIIIPNQQNENTQSILDYDDGQVKSIFEDNRMKSFYEQELNFVMNKFKMTATQEEEEVDIVLQWSMPQLNKKGFYCLFKIPLLKVQKQLTEQQNKLQRQRSIKSKDDGQAIQSARELPKLNPLHIAYFYEKEINHDFRLDSNGNTSPAIVTFTLSISNMIQSKDFQLSCKVEAINEWTQLSNPTDVSEADSFLWIGKSQHIIKGLKTNVRFSLIKQNLSIQEIKRVEMKCAILKPGVYNLNRFRIVMIEDDSQVKHHFVSEIKLPDDILITVKNQSSLF
eukprot:403333495